MNRILCSTGTMVGKANAFDHRVILENHGAVEADGFELMMLSAWYDHLPRIAADLAAAGVKTPVIHFEKDLGAMLARGGEEAEEGLRLFEKNAEMAEAVGAEKAVFHLWDGRFTAEMLAGAIERLGALCEICARHRVALLTEGVPCHVQSPLAVLGEIAARYPSAHFTFDTRHSDFMGECEAFLQSPLFEARVAHIHVSDYTGQTVPGLWGVTRPIVQPGEGIIDFPKLLSLLPPYHGGTVTLESPVLSREGDLDLPKLNRSLHRLAEHLQNR